MPGIGTGIGIGFNKRQQSVEDPPGGLKSAAVDEPAVNDKPSICGLICLWSLFKAWLRTIIL